MRKHSLDTCNKVALARGGKCLEDKYINGGIKIKWECLEKHRWDATFYSVNGGSWCPFCCKSPVTTIDDAKNDAKVRGGKCLSNKYKNNVTKMQWKCKYGHIWDSSLLSIRSGSWCPICAGNKKKTIQYVRRVIESKGGVCISKKYNNSTSKLDIVCMYGHIFSASYSNISAGKWCRKCAKNKYKNTISDCKKLAAKTGGKCLSNKYINNIEKLNWVCSNGHLWSAAYKNIISGHWCPICNKFGGVTQNKIATIVKLFTKYNVYQNFRGFSWLVNPGTGKRLELDIWVPELGLAIEYDGEQHFRPVSFGGMTKQEAIMAFKNTVILDTIKNKKIADNRDIIKSFVRISYVDRKIINKDYVLNIIKQAHMGLT